MKKGQEEKKTLNCKWRESEGGRERQEWRSNEGASRGRWYGLVYSKPSRGCILPFLPLTTSHPPLPLPVWHLPLTPQSHTLHTRGSGPINWGMCVRLCLCVCAHRSCMWASAHSCYTESVCVLCVDTWLNMCVCPFFSAVGSFVKKCVCTCVCVYITAPCERAYFLYVLSTGLVPFCMYSMTVWVCFRGRRQKSLFNPQQPWTHQHSMLTQP